MLPKSTQESSRAPNWRTFAVKMPLLKASLFLSTFLNGFQCFFEGSDPQNSMVFTTPNQLSLVLQKVRFLTLFGHLLAPKMLCLGAPWRSEGGQSRSRGAKKTHPRKRRKKRPKKKPVLAREREARFILGLQLTNSHALQKKERILRFLKQLPNTRES